MIGVALKAWTLFRALPPTHFAAAPLNPTTANLCSGAGVDCSSQKAATDPLNTHIQTISDTLLYVAGAVAVIIVILGGITYVTSNGDATRVKQAKETILYAIVGLVVVILAYAIVNYVAGNT